MSIEWAELFDIKAFSEANPQGFTGFEKVTDLGNACANVPKEAGVYMILLPGEIEQPAFFNSFGFFGARARSRLTAPPIQHDCQNQAAQKSVQGIDFRNHGLTPMRDGERKRECGGHGGHRFGAHQQVFRRLRG